MVGGPEAPKRGVPEQQSIRRERSRRERGGGTMRKLVGLVAVVVIGLLGSVNPSAWAVNPVGGGNFNVQSHVDLRTLTRANFNQVLAPVAKGQSVVFYDFADTLCELLAKEVGDWSRSSGVGVKHVCVDG